MSEPAKPLRCRPGQLALIKVRAHEKHRAEVLQLCEVFRARVVDITPESLVVEITGTADKIDGLLNVLRPFGIDEMVQSGAIAMTRGAAAASGPAGLPLHAIDGA